MTPGSYWTIESSQIYLIRCISTFDQQVEVQFGELSMKARLDLSDKKWNEVTCRILPGKLGIMG